MATRAVKRGSELPWSLVAAIAVARAALSTLMRPRPNSRPELPSDTRQRASKAPPAPADSSRHGRSEAGEAFGEKRSTQEPHAKQVERAHEPARGREAEKPTDIPSRGWKDILWRTYEEIQKHRVLSVAGGVVFFSLLAIFPGITALVSSYGLFFDYSTINDHLALLSGFMPEGAFSVIKDQVTRIVSKGGGSLTFGFLFGLAIALWSANAGMKAIFDALNIIYDEEEKRSFIKLNAITLLFTVGAIAAMLLAVGAVVVFPVILSTIGISKINPWIISLLRWPILAALIVGGLALIYRYGPSRNKARWRWLSVGSVAAAVAWIVASLAFSYYLSHFADYNATYGSLGAVMGLMMWMWISAIVVLVGGELNAETEHQTARDSTEDQAKPEKPLGARGATMADTVGEAKTA